MFPLSVRFKTAVSILIITTPLLTHWTKSCRKNWRKTLLSSQSLPMRSRTWNNRYPVDNCRGAYDAKTDEHRNYRSEDTVSLSGWALGGGTGLGFCRRLRGVLAEQLSAASAGCRTARSNSGVDRANAARRNRERKN